MADEIMDRSNYIFKKIISNEKIVYSNYKIWNYDYDKWLMDYVIIFNFNFDIIAEKFQEIIAFPLKYDFTEEEIRRHWAFLHAARKLDIEIDNAYYNELKEKNDSLKEKEKLIEEENIKDIQKELDLEKINAERFEFSLGKKNKIEETEIIDEKNEENNDELDNANDQPIILIDPMNSNQQSEKIKDIPSTHNITEEDEDEKIFNEILNTKKYYKELNYQNFNNDDNIFPISITKPSSLPQECNIIEEDLQNTPNMDDYIHESDELNKQYEDLNTYYNFAVKSLNYYMPKLNPDKLQDKEIQPTEEEIMIKKASEQINQLILDKINEKSEPEELPLEDQNKLDKFKTHLFAEAKNIATPDLLSKIINIIQTAKYEDIQTRNEKAEEEQLNETHNKRVITNKNIKNDDYDSFEDD